MPFSLIGGLIGSAGSAAAGGQASSAGYNASSTAANAAANANNLANTAGSNANNLALTAGQNAANYAYNTGTGLVNSYTPQLTANSSPYTNLGTIAVGQIGQLYGYGTPFYNDGNLEFGGGTPQQGRDAAMGNFFTSPGYNYRISQGTAALDQGAAAKGMALSGQQQQALTDYGQSQGSQEFNNWLQGLYNQAGAGATANNALNSNLTSLYGTGMNIAGQGTNALLQGGLQGANAVLQGGLTGANAVAQAGNVGANSILQGGLSSAGYTQSSANALANGIMSGGNNLLSLYNGGFFNGLGTSSYGVTPSSTSAGVQAGITPGGGVGAGIY